MIMLIDKYCILAKSKSGEVILSKQFGREFPSYYQLKCCNTIDNLTVFRIAQCPTSCKRWIFGD